MIYEVNGHRLVIQNTNMPDKDYIKNTEGYLTAKEVIDMHDEENRNQVPMSVKMRLLEEIERLVQKEVITSHITPEGFDPRSHFVDFGPDTELYAYAPYHVLYIYYIEMRIAMMQNDTKRYNMYTTLYDNAILTFQQEYNRNNKRETIYSPYYNHARGGY